MSSFYVHFSRTQAFLFAQILKKQLGLANHHPGARSDQCLELFDLLIGQGDAPLCPVELLMDVQIAAAHAMDPDMPTQAGILGWNEAAPGGPLDGPILFLTDVTGIPGGFGMLGIGIA